MHLLESEHGFSSDLKSHAVRVERHGHGRECRLYLVESVPPLHADVPLIISECLFNLRSALDQLVFQLHVRRFKGRVPSDAEKASQFPILDDPRARIADTAKWNEIKRLGVRQRTTIKNLQPYVRRNDRWHQTRARLSALHRLNNIDKHRRLHIARTRNAPVPQHHLFSPESGFRQTVFFGPLEAGAYVERWTFTDPPADVGMNHKVWSQVAVDEPTLGVRYYVYELLWQIIDDVERVLMSFTPYFPNDQPWWQRRVAMPYVTNPRER